MTDVTISAAIMCHPRRKALGEQLRDQLEQAFPTALVVDQHPELGPSAMRTSMAAWSAVEKESSHHLVLQDDATLSDDFTEKLRLIVSQRPDDVILLFAKWSGKTGQLARLAALTGKSFSPALLNDMPTVAVVMPSEIAIQYSKFAEEISEPEKDARVLAIFFKDAGIKPLVAVPNIVEHDRTSSGSLISRSELMGLRRSACFLDRYDVPWNNELLKEVDPLPYLSSWDLRAQCGSPVSGENYERAIRWVERSGISYESIVDLYHEVLREVPVSPEFGLSDGFLLQICTSLVGLTQYLPPIGELEGFGLAQQRALATIVPGALHRVFNEARLDVIDRSISPFVESFLSRSLATFSPKSPDVQAAVIRQEFPEQALLLRARFEFLGGRTGCAPWSPRFAR